MSLLNNGQPVPLRKIPSGAYVLVAEGRWRRLAKWVVLDANASMPDTPRFQVHWSGTELYPDSYVKEPSWPVWDGAAPPVTAGGGGS